ncbi:zinc/cadmium/mercury/lead-transporting ATPase [Pantoea sp. Z09]|uniref:zinc/cadmium/mercury/lead-transporting ATPase n=1 Tax=Pantoea sp. Z09 TaxID=2886821 RepID=UPI001EFC3C6D|nr:zinc/cadmium/mercury/lead-transporting ATPase [Pantoea sp. Z09]
MHSHHHACGCGRACHTPSATKPLCAVPAASSSGLTIRAASPVQPDCGGGCCAANSSPDSGGGDDDEGDRRGAWRFSWRVSGMDCPSCARTVETAVSQLPEVLRTRVVFASEKLQVGASADVAAAVEQAVARAGFSLISDAAPAAPPSRWRENRTLLLLAFLMLVSVILSQFMPRWGDGLFIATTLIGLWPVARSAWRRARSGSPFTIEMLMSVAAAGALLIGAHAEAAMVLLLFLLGERLEAFAAARARSGVTQLMALRPESATRIAGDKRESVALAALRPGDLIEVAAGGRLPVDGRLLNDEASFDESALTGESLPVTREKGEALLAGAASVDRLVRIEVTSKPGESAIDRILTLIEEADSHRAPVERFIDRFSRLYTPLIMLLAALVMVAPPLLGFGGWLSWIYKGLTLLLIGCPCALVIATPAAITSGLAAAARQGALIKGGAALERLSQVRAVAFDKTGTLTQGKPQVTAVLCFATASQEELLALAAAVEQGSTHPLATAIVAAASARQLPLPAATHQLTLAGSGIAARIAGAQVELLSPGRAAALNAAQRAQIAQQEEQGQTLVAILRDGEPIGALALRDNLRADARDALAALKKMGIESLMLTGDNPRAAAAIARELDIEFRAGLLPADKVEAVRALGQQRPLAMVGDGINDAPAMKAATIGIAMGSGSDIALESADAALTRDALPLLPSLVALARRTRATLRQNIAIALGLKALFLVTTLLGLTGLWLAVVADSGATALVTANALRLLRARRT